MLQIIAQNKCVSLLSFATEKTRQILVSADDCRSCNFCNTFLYERFLFHCCKCWNEVVGVSPIIPSRAFFLLWLKEPISGELVKEEHPLINRVIAKKSTASFQHLHLAKEPHYNSSMKVYQETELLSKQAGSLNVLWGDGNGRVSNVRNVALPSMFIRC